ncbi:MAG: VWA domain-containing protein [Phycisphaeraceae bacterium]|nr:VWA domain-containing protein [Phycisphaeraceae bacterium]
MTFLAPWAAAIGAALTIPPLVAFYFLKLRRRDVAVSSTLLWKKAIRDMQANAPFQRLRTNLLLLVQLLLLALLLLAMARPTLRGEAVTGAQTVILIDRSGSMNAQDDGQSRLEAAKEQATRLVADIGAGSAMVVTFDRRAKVIEPFTGDLASLRSAIDSIEGGDGLSHLQPALELIEPFAAGREEEPLTVYVFSDGRVEDKRLTLRGAKVRYVRLGDLKRPPANVAVASLAARRDYEDPQRVQVLARVINTGATRQSVSMTLTVDRRTERVINVDLPPASPEAPGEYSIRFDLRLPQAAEVGVWVDSDDGLEADNRAALVVAPPKRLRVLLVTAGNGFLTQAIKAAEPRRLVEMEPAQYARLASDDLAGRFDAVIFDRYQPDEVPPVPSLSFGAAPPLEGLKRVRIEDKRVDPGILDWQRDHPLLEHVAMSYVLLAEPARLELPDDAEPIATGAAGPLMAELVRDRRRHVVVGFDVLQTNWPMQVSFAVFVSNALDALAAGHGRRGAGIWYRPGEVAEIPVPSNLDTITYSGPVELTARVENGRAVLPAFPRAGVYRTSAAVEPTYAQIAVNLASARESDLRPVEQLQVVTTATDTPDDPAVAGVTNVRQEVWHWFAWAALVVLMIEWVLYTRRMHL